MAFPILIVTDDPRVRAELEDAFSSDFAVTIAEDARAAEDAMTRFTPALVIVDLRTGSAGGFGLVRDMRQDARLADVPALMLLERPQDEWLARVAGAQRIRTKPVPPAVLLAEARSLLPAAESA